MASSPTYAPIATQTLSSATNTVTFSSISGSYTDLVLIASVRKGGSANEAMFITFNGDSNTNYSFTILTGSGTASTSVTSTNGTKIQWYGQETASNTFALNILNIQDYSNTTTYKTVIGRNANPLYRTASTIGLWRSTSAITSITLTPDAYLSPNFEIGSSFTLYGIQAA